MRSIRKPARVSRLVALLTVPAALVLGALPSLANSADNGQVEPTRKSSTEQNGVALMRIVAADKGEVDKLADLGVDLVEYSKPLDNGIEVHAVLSPEETEALRGLGFDVQGKISDQDDYRANVAERKAAIAATEALALEADSLTVLRAEWFTSLDGNRFLSFEIKSDAGADSATVISASWDTGMNTPPASGGTATMSRFTDAGEYMYHRFTSPLALNTPSRTR